MQDYETSVDKYNSTLEDAGATVPKKPPVLTMADAVQKEVTFLHFQHNINVLHLFKDQSC